MPWRKPAGKTMVSIFCLGAGGAGGRGGQTSNSTAAGGGGGGSGSQTRVSMPLSLVPDVLYVRFGATSLSVSASPQSSGSDASCFAFANAGGAGGNASGATAGTGGTAGAAATDADMQLGFAYAGVLAGQAGTAGGAANATGGNLTLPTTGLLVSGGTGGGGMSNLVDQSGKNGGAINATTPFPALAGGLGATNDTTVGGDGLSGLQPLFGVMRLYGGTGGGACFAGSGTSFLRSGNGGNGAPGCGGGGGAGSYVSPGVPGVGGRGGDALVIITCW